MTPDQKEQLETRDTNALRKKYPGPLTRVFISDDGKTAVFYVDGKPTEQRAISTRDGGFYLEPPHAA